MVQHSQNPQEFHPESASRVYPESASLSYLPAHHQMPQEAISALPPEAKFSVAQRQAIGAWAVEHPAWSVRLDYLALEDTLGAPERVVCETIDVALPSYLSVGSPLNGWTIYPASAGRVVVDFDDNLAVLTIQEALDAIARLEVYEATEEDELEASRCCVAFARHH